MKLSDRCTEAYNAINAYNFNTEHRMSPFTMFHGEKNLERAVNSLTKEDWKELKKECPEQYKNLLQYK